MAKLTVFEAGQEVGEIELQNGQEYWAGRSTDCDIRLLSGSGISRRHFRLYHQDGVWMVEVMSKFGEITFRGSNLDRLELSEDLSFQLGPYEFVFKLVAAQDFEKSLVSVASDSFVDDARISVEAEESKHSSEAFEYTLDESGPGESTRVQPMLVRPVLRIVSADDLLASEKKIQLGGNFWTAGRDPSCEVRIDNNHVSRKQFAISATDAGYFVTDLGSSNGTLLNNKNLPPNEPVKLQSGDAIRVSSVIVYFEIHDINHGQRKPQRENSLTLAPEPSIGVQNSPEPEEPLWPEQSPDPSEVYPLRIEQVGLKPGFDWKRHRVRIAIGAGVTALLLATLLPNLQKPRPPAPANDRFNALTTEQKAFVRDSYELAKNLASHRKWEMALAELQKIHQILPNYKESKALEAETRRASELRQEEMALEAETQKQELLRQKVLQVVEDCRAQLGPRPLPSSAQSCLAPALELDPSNEGARSLLSLAEQTAAENERLEDARNKLQKAARALENICSQGDRIAKAGNLSAARRAYQKCLATALPDPRGLKSVARRNLASINAEISSRLKAILSDAEELQKKGDLKGALKTLGQAKKVDSESSEYIALLQKIDRDATGKMKALYSDSVLEESLGQVESAKEKWQKILDFGLTESEYYKRARRKLQRYGVL